MSGSLMLDLSDPDRPVLRAVPEILPSSSEPSCESEHFVAFKIPLKHDLEPRELADCMDSILPQCEKLVGTCQWQEDDYGRTELAFDNYLSTEIQKDIFRELRTWGDALRILNVDGLKAPLQ